MFCKNCGNQLNKDSKFCGKCGNENTKENLLEKSSPAKSNIGELTKVNEPVMKFHIGRLGRSGFILSMVISFAIILLLALLNAPTGVLMTFVYINFAWMLVLYTGRLHDVGKSAWWTIPVMILSLLGMIVLACISSKKETNKYGEVPPKSISHLLYFWRTRKII